MTYDEAKLAVFEEMDRTNPCRVCGCKPLFKRYPHGWRVECPNRANKRHKEASTHYYRRKSPNAVGPDAVSGWDRLDLRNFWNLNHPLE